MFQVSSPLSLFLVEVFDYFVGRAVSDSLVVSIKKSTDISFVCLLCFSSLHFFNNNYVLNSTDPSIQDCILKLQSWIEAEYAKVKAEISRNNPYYASSLMIQLFIRRVVEMYFIERCYDKLSHCLIDHSMADEIHLQCILDSIQVVLERAFQLETWRASTGRCVFEPSMLLSGHCTSRCSAAEEDGRAEKRVGETECRSDRVLIERR